MRGLIQVLAVLALSALSPAAFAASTDVAAGPPDLSGELRAALDIFAFGEFDGATAEQRDMMVECILPVFDGIDHEMLALALAEDDFERGLVVVLTAYPEREEIIEGCEELL
jgi:hypothetical protein